MRPSAAAGSHWRRGLPQWTPREGGDAHPRGLLPSVAPLTIVAGAPCSGKSSFVGRNAGGSDLVIDLDTIAGGLAQTSPHAWNRDAWLTQALKARNGMLLSLADAAPQWPAAWFLVSAPAPGERLWWARNLRPRQVVVIETAAEICLDRLFADPERQINRSATVVAINEWWRRYHRGRDETVASGCAVSAS